MMHAVYNLTLFLCQVIGACQAAIQSQLATFLSCG